jgi:predicted nucleic acid-binding protein
LLAKIVAGDLVILSLSHEDVPAIAGMLAKYHDQSIDFADACLLHLAEREAILIVFSVDCRHFSVYRTQSGRILSCLERL